MKIENGRVKVLGCTENAIKFLLVVVLLVNGTIVKGQASGESMEKKVTSPDKHTTITLYQKTDKTSGARIFYKVDYKGKPVILESELGLKLDNHISQLALALAPDKEVDWFRDLKLIGSDFSSCDTVWHPLYGERNQIRDHFHQLTLHFEKNEDPRYKIDLIVRAYNQGVAFRYYFPENPTGVYYRIVSEEAEFSFPENTKAWYEQWAQGPFVLLPLENWSDECERPLTLEMANGLYVCLAEASMVDYSRAKFALKENKPNTLVTSLYESVDLITYFHTPWRVIMVGEKSGDLVENNSLILNLNEPSKLANTGWIKPGKIIREMTLTDANAKACIDFAAAHNMQYVLFDWKWYGPALTLDSDATVVRANLDMPEIIRYGNEKNVGIWLYVNQQALLKQDHEIFPLYKKWGVKGVKYGFVQVGSHRWTTWLHESVQRAADNELMVNIHDEFRTTGESRTWPNILTVEGIRGNEEMPDATHNTVLPFTRGIAGAGDYTICYYSNRIKTTHGHQLALGVVNYSPLQTLFWYDKPSDYQGEPEIEFFEKLPTVWDETRVLQGKIGEYIVTARRKGEEWFVGAITNNEERTVDVPLDFLLLGKKYTATIYSDDPKIPTRTKVKVEQTKLTKEKTLQLKLIKSGGAALWIRTQEADAEQTRKSSEVLKNKRNGDGGM